MPHQPSGQRSASNPTQKHTTNPYTRLTPGTAGTVTGYDPQHAQFSDHEAGCNASELQFYVACMSATLVRGWL